jgi:hypothetical protein
MDIKIIINSLIILFILHIIILNINYHVVIGKKVNVENFDDKKIKDNSLNFLMDNTDNINNNNDEFKKKLLKYMQQDETIKETEFDSKNINKVGASNTYLSDNNYPNFESNVADISKFYKVNYDNLNEDELKSTSIEKLNKDNKIQDNKIQDNININVNTKEPSNIKNYGRESIETPDNWVYKNELPMNGGQMNGIIGFDSLESQFAIYNPNKLNLQMATESKFNNIPHDDLRKPIVYEN